MRPQIVLDKSYLAAHTTAEIHDLCRDFCVLAPSLLFYELFACSPSVRRRCFRKFPATINPVELAGTVGRLLQFESKQHTPARPLYKHRAPMLFTFSSGLAEGTFHFNERQREGIRSWRLEIEADAQQHIELCTSSEPMFPGIRGSSGRLNKARLAEIRSHVVADSKMIRLFFNKLRKRSYPRKDELNPNWTFYRWIQVHLLAVLRHWERCGLDAPPPSRLVVEHDVVDMQLQILGIIAGRIATRDKYVRNVVTTLAPSTMVLA